MELIALFVTYIKLNLFNKINAIKNAPMTQHWLIIAIKILLANFVQLIV